jgi:hypothetical protein
MPKQEAQANSYATGSIRSADESLGSNSGAGSGSEVSASDQECNFVGNMEFDED